MTHAPRKGLRLATVSLAVILGAAAPSFAQQPAPAPTPEATPARGDARPGAGAEGPGGGLGRRLLRLQLQRDDPALRSFDVLHNTFSLSAAEVNFTKVPTADSRVGFRTDLLFGRAADLTAALRAGRRARQPGRRARRSTSTSSRPTRACSLGSSVQCRRRQVRDPDRDGGDRVAGQLELHAVDLFGYAIPFYHTGVRATVTGDARSSTLAGYLVNGWNNGIDIDGDKTFALGATLKPTGSLTWVGNYMVGQEAEDLDTRHLFDTTLTLVATSKLSFMGNFDYGKEGDVEWWGIAAYAKLQATPSWAVAARYEYLDDTKGGFMTFGTKAQTITVTSDHTIAGAFKARLEYRTDFADEDIFETDDGSFKGSQTTLTVGVVYSFGGGLF